MQASLASGYDIRPSHRQTLQSLLAAMVMHLIGGSGIAACCRSGLVLQLLLLLEKLAVSLYPTRCNSSCVHTLPTPSVFGPKVRLGLLSTCGS